MIYPRRYELEPRKRKAYEVACDLIAVYELPRTSFDYITLGLNRVEMKEIWNYATVDMNGNSTVCYAS